MKSIDADCMDIAVKHASEAPARGDGKRVLVDRLWPRGRGKETLKLHLWLREIAPSTELRRWFGHDPAKWAQFRRRYFAELERNADVVKSLRGLAAKQRLTLVFAAADREHNNAVALHEYLSR